MYTDLLAAIAALKNLPATRGRTTDDDNQFLIQLLQVSAGMTAQAVVVYRIYYVAAKFLQQPGAIHFLESAEGGVKFTGLAVPIASLLALQHSEDLALGLIVPLGFEAVPTETASAPSKVVLPFGTGTYRVRAQP